MKSMFTRRGIWQSLAFCIGLVLVGSIVDACNVPVFRYALEHWRPDSYRAVLFYRGPITESSSLAAVQNGSFKTHANLTIRMVDVDQSVEPDDRALLAMAGTQDLPLLVVKYPNQLQVDKPVWTGRFAESELSTLLDSPKRQELLKRLTTGQTAVWLMIDGGDKEQDEAAASLLENELAYLKQNLKLPELTDSPEDAIQDGPPLRVEFSLLRVRRDDPAESATVAMLLNCEPDLFDLKEPIVFPIFGCSRVMLPLVGAGISLENIRGSAKFLSGACSCQVKDQNPGFDLLVKADWNTLLSWAKPLAIVTGEASSSEPAEAELVAIPVGNKREPISDPETATQSGQTIVAPSSSIGTNKSLITAAGILLAGLVLIVIRAKK